MNDLHLNNDALSTATRIDSACQQACQAIAPAWPLDRSIAVNPHWGRIGLPLPAVAARMALLGGVKVYPSREFFLESWHSGRIRAEDLQQAIAQKGGGQRDTQCDALQYQAALTSGDFPSPLPLLMDVLDKDADRAGRLPWRQAVTHQISQTCAAYFDQHQADWQPQQQGLYAFWRETLMHDHGIGILMGLPRLGQSLTKLPPTSAQAQLWGLEKLALAPEVLPDYLEAVLLAINGWASWCAYLQWQAELENRSDTHLRELLAICLAWGGILLAGEDKADTGQRLSALRQQWADLPAKLAKAQAGFALEEVWQAALEAGYQRVLAAQLNTAYQQAMHAVNPVPIEAQAMFCIDVRSEPLRRAIETLAPSVQTFGFAGFFGLPVAYTPLATQARRPQLPGLLAPALEVKDALFTADGMMADTQLRAASASRERRFSLMEQWRSASRWPAAAFSFVEAAGWTYSGKLSNWLHVKPGRRKQDDLHGLSGRWRAACRPSLAHLDLERRIDLAQRVWHVMGLQQATAPLVLLVGHGSQSQNNPHAAALDCGACCGQTGEVNARVLAQMLNDTAVRQGLLARGIRLPAETVFAAALHNTTTDELEWLDRDCWPAAAQPGLMRLVAAFAQASAMVRKERAPRLGMAPEQDAAALLRRLQQRACDGAQTRPEWGLANNASLIIAPRSSTRGISLDGRSFLHDYDASQDTDGSTLELLMTAPMLVAHWINWQYHASRCEPELFGSGNKVLHNVVGGYIGVFEGNGGDLRIGLSKQSVHDGQRWMHEPLRLTVVIAADQQRIEAIIRKHASVRQLVEHGWLHLWQLEAGVVARRIRGQWQTDCAMTAQDRVAEVL